MAGSNRFYRRQKISRFLCRNCGMKPSFLEFNSCDQRCCPKCNSTEIGEITEIIEIFDRQAAIHQILSELERLGWDRKKQQHHLHQNYGKQFKMLLDKTELMGFLEYLEGL